MLRICSNMWALSAMKWRISTKASMILMLTSMAVGLRSTAESMETPCSVKTRGMERRPPHPSSLEITNCDFKITISFFVSLKQKCSGKRSGFLVTAWLSVLAPGDFSHK